MKQKNYSSSFVLDGLWPRWPRWLLRLMTQQVFLEQSIILKGKGLSTVQLWTVLQVLLHGQMFSTSESGKEHRDESCSTTNLQRAKRLSSL